MPLVSLIDTNLIENKPQKCRYWEEHESRTFKKVIWKVKNVIHKNELNSFWDENCNTIFDIGAQKREKT